MRSHLYGWELVPVRPVDSEARSETRGVEAFDHQLATALAWRSRYGADVGCGLGLRWCPHGAVATRWGRATSLWDGGGRLSLRRHLLSGPWAGWAASLLRGDVAPALCRFWRVGDSPRVPRHGGVLFKSGVCLHSDGPHVDHLLGAAGRRVCRWIAGTCQKGRRQRVARRRCRSC